jgi:DNA repair protein RadA/Sms
LGRCPECGGWNTFQEELIRKESFLSPSNLEELISIDKIETLQEARISSGSKELDIVLGGGIVNGSLIIVGGEPGIGKSTLLLQMANSLAESHGSVLYLSGEESREQIKLRAERLGKLSSGLYVVSETDLSCIVQYIERLNPNILIVDSIQTIYHNDLTSPPGSVGQIRDCTYQLMRIAKQSGLVVFLIGHVTKEGLIAGPKLLEHMVDTVLYFEENSQHPYRMLRAVKNRFGSTNEVAIFEMTSGGLKEVSNPSEIFLSERTPDFPGTVVFPAVEGSRPLLVEIQALTGYSSYPQPRRSANGVDVNRLFLVLAVLEKRLGLTFGNRDVYVNVVGGVKIPEPAADLAIAVAICSSFWEKAVKPHYAVFGEVGLTGEVRSVIYADRRLSELEKMGFENCVVPLKNLESFSKDGYGELKFSGVKSLEETLHIILGMERLK